MKPVYQTKFGEPDGNCLEAALASIFEADIDDFPHFVAEDDWVVAFTDFMVSSYGLQPLCLLIDSDGWTPVGYHLIGGESPRGDFHHVLVGKDGIAIHDPHPEGNCQLRTTETYTLFVKVFE